jgi:hypothetical protein
VCSAQPTRAGARKNKVLRRMMQNKSLLDRPTPGAVRSLEAALVAKSRSCPCFIALNGLSLCWSHARQHFCAPLKLLFARPPLLSPLRVRENCFLYHQAFADSANPPRVCQPVSGQFCASGTDASLSREPEMWQRGCKRLGSAINLTFSTGGVFREF